MSWDEVFALGRTQRGVVARRQAIAIVGPTAWDRRIRREGWERPHRNVALLPGARCDPLAVHAAAVLSASDAAMITRESSLWLHAVDHRPPRRPQLIEPYGKAGRAPTGSDLTRSRTLEEADRVVQQGLPCAAIPRTFLDLAATRSTRHVRAKLIDAAAAGHDLSPIYVRAARARGATGRPKLLHLVASLDPAMADSIFSAEVHDRLVASGFSPDPRPVAVRTPERLLHPDITFSPATVGIEADGLNYHRTRAQLELDHRKTNQYLLAGWAVLRIDRGRYDTDWAGFCRELHALLTDRAR